MWLCSMGILVLNFYIFSLRLCSKACFRAHTCSWHAVNILIASDFSFNLTNLSVGCFLVPLVMHTFTKRTAAIYAIWIWAIGYILTVAVTSYWPLVIGRGIKGLSMGFLSGVIPPYIQECFSETVSPSLLSLFQIFFPLGVFIMAIVAYLGCIAPFSIFEVSFCWKLMMTLTMPAVFFSLFIRSSPHDFLFRGYNSQALDTLIDMYGDISEANEKMKTLFLLCRRQAAKSKWQHICDAFSPSCRQRIILAVFCQASMQLSGVNIISIMSFKSN